MLVPLDIDPEKIYIGNGSDNPLIMPGNAIQEVMFEDDEDLQGGDADYEVRVYGNPLSFGHFEEISIEEYLALKNFFTLNP